MIAGKIFPILCLGAMVAGGLVAYGQGTDHTTTKDTSARPIESRYDYVEAFRPFFYTGNGNRYRSASGQPGPDYWQNKVDYQIKAHLDETTRTITATVVMQYTNNSPDALDFLWIQLDQNLFAKDSRGRITLPQANSRYGDVRSEFDGGYAIRNVSDGTGN